MPDFSTLLRTFAPAAALAALPATAGDTFLQDVESFDTDRAHATGGMLRDDQASARSSVITVPASGLPEASDLDAYAVTGDDTVYFSTDVTVETDGLLIGPGDVVRVDPGGTLSLEISAAAVGLPAGADTDAVTLTDDPAMPLALSFDTTVELPAAAGTILVEDEDLAKTDGAVFELFFDGSADGVDPAADLDGAYLDAEGGELRVSFDVAGELDGVAYDDEDVMALDLTANTWRLARDGSTALPPGADLDAYSARVTSTLIFADGFESGDTSAW